MLAVYLFRATSGAHHQEGLVMTLTASSSSRAVTNSPVVVALDYHNRDDALAFVDKIDPRDCRLKVGKEMFTLFGPQFVRELQQRGFDIFLDLKFHDIPNTARFILADNKFISAVLSSRIMFQELPVKFCSSTAFVASFNGCGYSHSAFFPCCQFVRNSGANKDFTHLF